VGFNSLTFVRTLVVKLMWNVRECRTCVVKRISKLRFIVSRGSQGENDFFRNGLRRFSRKVDITLKKELIIPFVFVFFLLRFANSDPLHTVQ
jgi:hypothetical protein